MTTGQAQGGFQITDGLPQAWDDQVNIESLSTDVEAELYHSDRSAISSSGLNLLRKSPLHFVNGWRNDRDEKPESEAFRLGRLVHLAILEGEKFLQVHRVEPDFGDMRKKENKEAREKWRSDLAPGSVLLSEEEMETVKGCVASLASNEMAMKILRDGMAELSGLFRDPMTNLKCKIRPDFVRMKDNWLVDFKTAQDSSLESFQRSVINYGYDLQMAFYFDGIERITGRQPSGAAWVVMEKSAPYDVSVYALDAITLEEGRRLYKNALKILAECLETGRWPGRNDGKIRDFSYPKWKLHQLETGQGLEFWGGVGF